MNPEAQEKLDEILKKEPEVLTDEEKAFLRARRSYLKKSQLQEFDSIINPKEAKPAKKQTAKEDGNPKQTN